VALATPRGGHGVVPPPATFGLRIGLIHLGSYVSEIFDQGQRGVIEVENLYVEKDKQFLVNLFIPALSSSKSKEREEKTT
jgi:hypothetical protein